MHLEDPSLLTWLLTCIDSLTHSFHSLTVRWSTRGVGLTRVLAAIRVRSGPTVKLVFESPKQFQKKRDVTAQQAQQREEAARAAQAQKDVLLKELQATETEIKKGKFLGLF